MKALGSLIIRWFGAFGGLDSWDPHTYLHGWYGKYPIIYMVLYITGGWPWDFWTINSMKGMDFHWRAPLVRIPNHRAPNQQLPSRKLTYPATGKEKTIFKSTFGWYIYSFPVGISISWRQIHKTPSPSPEIAGAWESDWSVSCSIKLGRIEGALLRETNAARNNQPY